MAAPAGDADLRTQAESALRKAGAYFHRHASSHGGYVYFVSEDLRQRWGEGAATSDQIFVQPPGTPAVGEAYLKAYGATRDRQFLQAAHDAGKALVYGQLQSGGWTQKIDFNPKGSYVALYRNGKGKGRNHTSLDDGQTQAAIAFLAHLDRALEFKDPAIGEATRFALAALLKAQFPNGAFPQGFTGPVSAQPVIKASYPDDWPRTWPNEPYWNFYTLNDGMAGSVARTLLTAFTVYKDKEYDAALRRLGDFLLLAQMPEPQPAWCQQYNYAMQPMWARRFEPPAICGLESEDVIATLMMLHGHTGDTRYLAPIPRAIAYLKQNRQPDGMMPRYFELRTNRPLYMNRKGQDYFLTYDDTNLPSHYGWKQNSRIDALEREFAAGQRGEPVAPIRPSLAQREAEVRKVLQALDAEGRWVSTYAGERLVGQPKFANGFRYLDSGVFNRNVELLSDYLVATARR